MKKILALLLSVLLILPVLIGTASAAPNALTFVDELDAYDDTSLAELKSLADELMNISSLYTIVSLKKSTGDVDEYLNNDELYNSFMNSKYDTLIMKNFILSKTSVQAFID